MLGEDSTAGERAQQPIDAVRVGTDTVRDGCGCQWTVTQRVRDAELGRRVLALRHKGSSHRLEDRRERWLHRAFDSTQAAPNCVECAGEPNRWKLGWRVGGHGVLSSFAGERRLFLGGGERTTDVVGRY